MRGLAFRLLCQQGESLGCQQVLLTGMLGLVGIKHGDNSLLHGRPQVGVYEALPVLHSQGTQHALDGQLLTVQYLD